MTKGQAQLVERSITELGKLEFRIVAYKESGTGSQLKGTDIDFEAEKKKLTEWWQKELDKGGETWVDENAIRRFNALSAMSRPVRFRMASKTVVLKWSISRSDGNRFSKQVAPGAWTSTFILWQRSGAMLRSIIDGVVITICMPPSMSPAATARCMAA